MNEKETGGSAFPDSRFCEQGMTLRDYFAAKAMQGMLSCDMFRATEQEFATKAYCVADAMLEARK